MRREAIIIDKKDNVATAVQPLKQGEEIQMEIEEDILRIIISQDIPSGHKFALKDIARGQSVIKYGEIIGLSTEIIEKGRLVHVHNVEGIRGRGDKT